MEKLSVSQEDYLKEIYLMHVQGHPVRATDIARLLGISKPSVTKAINLLKRQGYISHESYGAIELTPEGLKAGEELANNYRTVYKFLVDVLGVPPETAGAEAHGIEHVISKGTRKKMKKHIKKQIK